MNPSGEEFESDKLQRLYFKTYLKVIKNSIGTQMFRNFYVEGKDGKEFDALDDGENSCAFFTSSILVIFAKIKAIHGTVANTEKDILGSGWIQVDEPKPGDILVWEAQEFPDGKHEHIGFYVGNDRAISTSSAEKKVIEHELNFGSRQRKIVKIYRVERW